MNYASPFYAINPALVIAIFIWSMFWKLLALWRCVKNEQRYWFIGLMLLNTVGILEIVYLFGFAKKKITLEEIKKTNFLP